MIYIFQKSQVVRCFQSIFPVPFRSSTLNYLGSKKRGAIFSAVTKYKCHFKNLVTFRF